MDNKDDSDAQQSSLQQEGYDLMSAVFEVYRVLGHGFFEEVYQESLERELSNRKIKFTSKPTLPVYYKGAILKKGYEADLVVSGGIVVELKSARALAPEHEAQVFNYLKATKNRVGYLVNFGSAPRLQWKRFII